MKISVRSILFTGLVCTSILSCTQTVKKPDKVFAEDPIKKDSLTKLDTVNTQVDAYVTIGFIKPKGIFKTAKLERLVKEKIDSVETVDFTGDRVLDYIVRTAGDENSVGIEYWISSDYKIIKKTKYYLDAFHYRWFINLDDDPEPEIYDAVGEEDGADYTIMDQNLSNGKDTILLYVNPVIIEEGIKYWGYPWDITTIRARKYATNVKLYCSLDHKIVRDGGWEIDPKHQSQMPVIFFDGHHTQDFKPEKVKDMQWLTLKEIISRTRR